MIMNLKLKGIFKFASEKNMLRKHKCKDIKALHRKTHKLIVEGKKKPVLKGDNLIQVKL